MGENNTPKKVYTVTLSFETSSEMERFLRKMGLKGIWSGGNINSGDILSMPPTSDEGQISLYDSFEVEDSEE
jgi:hypothetical protein